MGEQSEDIIRTVEHVSEQIQVLALNIAVAAAKLSYRKEFSQEVNNKLSRLVEQATKAVKNMRHIVKAARSDRPKEDIFSEGHDLRIDSETVANIEKSMADILDESQKILECLSRIRQESLNKLGGR